MVEVKSEVEGSMDMEFVKVDATLLDVVVRVGVEIVLVLGLSALCFLRILIKVW